jgi:hypothetical protein
MPNKDGFKFDILAFVIHLKFGFCHLDFNVQNPQTLMSKLLGEKHIHEQ